MNKFKKWLIKKLGGYVEEPNREWYADNSLYKTDFVAPIITQIINADPVIKCKDCKHSIPDMSGDEIQGYECDFCYDSYWDANDFCSRGEKR